MFEFEIKTICFNAWVTVSPVTLFFSLDVSRSFGQIGKKETIFQELHTIYQLHED